MITTNQLVMGGWVRMNGRTWARKQGVYRAIVKLGPGGWYGIITDTQGRVYHQQSPTRRSRKARRELQHRLLALPVMPARITEHTTLPMAA